jgi:aspartyl-tRNA(Asn)/glutamyl-tRNA(Gln) amidotransferase subunit A
MSASTVSGLGGALRRGETTSTRIVDEALSHAGRLAHLNIFLTLDRDGARAAAAEADRELAAGRDRGPLHGLPVALKDNISTRGLRTTCASKFLDRYVPPFDATVVERLREAGAIVLGKTNLDEFAMGSSTENSAYGATRNPWDPSRVPGGSSGGSAAAVAAGIVPIALGSDTGGSVRQPAALCGVVGVKPSWGRVSRYGLVAFGSSLDQIGPFAQDVHGAAVLMDVLSGADPRDSTSSRTEAPRAEAALRAPSRRLRLGLPKQYVDTAPAAAVAALRAALPADAELVPISLPHTEFAIACYYVVASAEASSNLARFDGIRYGTRVRHDGASLADVYLDSRTAGFGPEVQRRILLGTFALSSGYYDAYYGKAQAARRAIREDFDAAFEKVDLVVGPTSPETAFPLGAKTADPLTMYLSDIFTIPASMAGLPAVSVPIGEDAAGLPWGGQVIAPMFAEAAMLAFADRIARPARTAPERA